MIRQGLRAAAVMIGVFGAGFAAGVFVERHHQISPVAHVGVEDAPQRALAEHDRALEELRDVVGLDDEQVAEVNRILARHQRDVQLQWEQLRPEVQQAMQQVHREIAQHLRPDQRERYHRWLQAMRQRHEQMAAGQSSTGAAEEANDRPSEEHPRP